jgi:hypothetical protein
MKSEPWYIYYIGHNTGGGLSRILYSLRVMERHIARFFCVSVSRSLLSVSRSLLIIVLRVVERHIARFFCRLPVELVAERQVEPVMQV